MKRYYKSGTQWCAPWRQKEGAPFATPASQAGTEISAQWGVPITAVDVEDAAPDPRSGVLLNLTLPYSPTLADAELAAIVAILSKPDTEVTAAELKSLALTAIRRMRRRGTL